MSMSAFGDQFANMFNVMTPVKNNSLYAPLTQEGEVCGVGVSLMLVHDPPLHIPSDHYTYINIIDAVAPNTSASRAGVQQDDIIVAVDGKELEYDRQVYLPEDVADMIRGPAGSDIVVGVQRDGKRFTFVLTREPLDVDVTMPPAGADFANITPSSSPVKKIRPVTP